MDGWALAAGDAGGDAFTVVGESRAGHGFQLRLGAGEAVRISTGAAIPCGANRLVRREQGREWRGVLRAEESVPGSDIRRRASDFDAGDRLVAAGTRIGPLELAVLAAGGCATVAVNRRPRVLIVPTGDELVAPGGDRRPGQIDDALSLPLSARCREEGAIVRTVEPAGDDENALAAPLAARRADIVVIVGGASNGHHDHARTSLLGLGAQVLVPRVAMRPGGPFWFGQLGDQCLVIGLPGNPVSALICAELFLIPLIRAWQGARQIGVETRASCAIRLPYQERLERVAFGRLELGEDGGTTVVPLTSGDSAGVLAIQGANCLFQIPAGFQHQRNGVVSVAMIQLGTL